MVKKGYKETEIGIIPEDWDIVSFKKCFNILPNNTLPRAELNETCGTVKNIHYGDILVKYNSVLNCSVANIPYINTPNKNMSSMYLMNGDIIIADTAEDDTVGKATEISNIAEHRIVSGLHTIPCRAFSSNMFSNGWLGYFINCRIYHDQLLPFITGTKVSAISKSAISDTLVVVPSLKEQQKIVDALSDMDNLISSLEKLIEKKKAIKQGAMHELLTGKKRLPGFSGEWAKEYFGKLCTICRGGSPRPIQNFLTNDANGINWIKIGDVGANDKYINSTAEKIKESGVSMSRRVYKGDFILSNSMSFGRPYILNIDGCIHDGWLTIQNYQENFNINYLYYLLGSEFVKEQYIQMAAGSSVQNLNKEKVARLVVHIPSVEEQGAISLILSDMDAEITALEQKLTKCQKLKQGMMQQLLTGKIRLVSNDDEVTDKPLVETLKVSTKGHNHQFDDAVVIAGIVDKFYSDKYPLGRKKVQKLLYLFRRHQEADTSAFKKKAAGPYADEVRYKGGEPIAISSKYISVKKGAKGSSFSKGEKIADALNYLENWNLNDDLKWLCEQFKYIKTDRLELLATIDMAICDLEDAGITVTVDSIKELIKSHSEWKEKLSKSYFKDNDIAWAIKECRRLFG